MGASVPACLLHRVRFMCEVYVLGTEKWSLEVEVLHEGGFSVMVSPGKWWMEPGMEVLQQCLT